MPGKLFIISAPSGAGKTSLVTALMNDSAFKDILERAVTYTSRAPRPVEVAGRDYHFISVEEFESRMAEGFFLEWSTAYGTYYGMPVSIMDNLARGISHVIILDRAGAESLARHYKNVVLIWIEVPSLAVLEERLKARGQDAPEQIARRLLLAHDEMQKERIKPFFHHHIMNNVFEDAYKTIKSIVCKELLSEQD